MKAFAYDSYGGILVSVSSGGKLFFSAFNTVHGREPWVTDGTAQGTHLVKNISLGKADGLEYYFRYHAYNFNGILYFQANDRLQCSLQ